MILSELLKAARRGIDRDEQAAERIAAGGGIEVIDAHLNAAAGSFGGRVDLVLEALDLLERVTSPLWRAYLDYFAQLDVDKVGPGDWRELQQLSTAALAQRELWLREWLLAPGRTLLDVQAVFSRAYARAVKLERENG